MQKIAFGVSVIGLIALTAIYLIVEPEEISISEVQGSKLTDVRINGKIIDIREFDSMAIMKIAEIKSVDVVVFDKRLVKETGVNVTVVGEMRDYRGKREIIADEIRVAK